MVGWLPSASRAGQRDDRLVVWCFQSRSDRWQAGCLVLPEQVREMTGWLSGASRAGQRDGRLVAWCFQNRSER